MIDVVVNKALLQELQVATQKVLAQKKLGTSDLSKSVEYVYRNDQFVLLANDYFIYVSTGRRPRARKVPVEDILKWMRGKGIVGRGGRTTNSIAYGIVQAIYKNGIKAKNYVNPVIDVTTDIISIDLAESLSESIATEIAKDLTFKL
jgi:hypothetical protein